MKFIITESAWTMLENLTYRGVIGLFYDSTLTGMLTYLLFGIICAFAIIGLFATVKWLFTRKKKKKPY